LCDEDKRPHLVCQGVFRPVFLGRVTLLEDIGVVLPYLKSMLDDTWYDQENQALVVTCEVLVANFIIVQPAEVFL
jgi:hypothetical protein